MTVFVNNGVRAADGAAPIYQIADGGTGQTTAGAALTALGGINNADHNGIDHTALPVPLLTQASHDASDHAGVTGVDAQTESVTTGSGLVLTRTIPGGTLAIDNERLEFKMWGVGGGIGDTVTFTFGGLQIAQINVGIGDPWVLRGTILRTGASAQDITCEGATGAQDFRVVTALNMATALALTATVTGSSPGDTFGIIVTKWAA